MLLWLAQVLGLLVLHIVHADTLVVNERTFKWGMMRVFVCRRIGGCTITVSGIAARVDELSPFVVRDVIWPCAEVAGRTRRRTRLPSKESFFVEVMNWVSMAFDR